MEKQASTIARTSITIATSMKNKDPRQEKDRQANNIDQHRKRKPTHGPTHENQAGAIDKTMKNKPNHCKPSQNNRQNHDRPRQIANTEIIPLRIMLLANST